TLASGEHAEGHYRDPDGNPTGELENLRAAPPPLRRPYGHTPARAFGPVSLRAVREEMRKLVLLKGHREVSGPSPGRGGIGATDGSSGGHRAGRGRGPGLYDPSGAQALEARSNQNSRTLEYHFNQTQRKYMIESECRDARCHHQGISPEEDV